MAQAQQDDSLPPLLVVVTGRGPLLAEYQARLRRLPLRRCAVRTAWLAPGDYPLLLGAADVGVCLHTSSSGLDLPMKVLPLASYFACFPCKTFKEMEHHAMREASLRTFFFFVGKGFSKRSTFKWQMLLLKQRRPAFLGTLCQKHFTLFVLDPLLL